jgi:hypothetical protein
MRRMLKYKMADVGGGAVHHMPSGAAIKMIGMQHDELYAWASTSPGPTVERHFITVGTGHNIREDAEYVGSCQDGNYVWHVFEVPR